MARSGQDYDAIARTLGMTTREVKHICKTLEISTKPHHGRAWSSKELVEIKRLHGNGQSIGDIARRLGRPRTSVRDRIKRLEQVAA